MKVVILAGGRGSRIEEESTVRPKPMVEIAGRPILWHIMKHYAHFGFNEFVIALGYKGEVIKDYFLNYAALQGDVSVDLATGEVLRRSVTPEAWRVDLVDTGLNTNTAGRVLRLRSLLGDEPFLCTYGDGVSNVDVHELVEFHRAQGRAATLTAVRPPARFGELRIDEAQGRVLEMHEKPSWGDGWINGGFMVLEPAFYDYVADDTTSMAVLGDVAAKGQLSAFRHGGYWQCMDTVRDRMRLEEEWPAWKVWA